MIKQCTACGRYFHHDSEELCERCRKTAVKRKPLETRRQCHCGEIFAPFHEKDYTCPACKRAAFDEMTEEERNKVYLTVRDFLYSNPMTPKVRVAERFGVPMRFIDEWIYHGKIQQIDEVDLKNADSVGYCKICGVKTHKGKICKPCEARMAERLESHNSAIARTENRGKVIIRR